MGTSLDYAQLEQVVDEWCDAFPALTDRLSAELTELRRKAAAWELVEREAEYIALVGGAILSPEAAAEQEWRRRGLL